MNALSKNIFVITNIGVCFTICYYYKEYIFYEKKIKMKKNINVI